MIFESVEVPDDARLFFMSDIHGEIKTLKSMLHDVGFDYDKDYLVCAGDLIDRGRDSKETMDFFLNDRTGRIKSVLGNHDVFPIQEDYLNWIHNGGSWALSELSVDEVKEIGIRMKALPYVLEVNHLGKKYGVVHAGIPTRITHWKHFLDEILKQPKTRKELNRHNELLHYCVWDRSVIEDKLDQPLEGVDYLIHGHTPVRQPTMLGNRVFIDTGLVYGKHLTLLEFDLDDNNTMYTERLVV